MTIQRMCVCEWHAGYLRLQTHIRYIIFVAFPRQQYLRERVLMLHYIYSACIVNTEIYSGGQHCYEV